MNNNKIKEAEKLAEKGFNLLKQDRFKAALKILEKAIKLDPKNVKAWRRKGYALYYLGRYKEALISLERALKLNSKDDIVWIHKGAALYELNRDKEALKAFERALKINPKNADAWTGKGRTLLILEQESQAIVALDKALKLNPKDVDALSSKGFALSILNRYDEALSIFEEALKLNPQKSLKKSIIKIYCLILKEKSKEDKDKFNEILENHKPNLEKEILLKIRRLQEIGKKPKKICEPEISHLIKSSIKYEMDKLKIFIRKELEPVKSSFSSRNLSTQISKPSIKTPLAKFPTPPGTKWDDVTIQFISDESIKISAKGVSKEFNYAEIGFKDNRRGVVPDNQWKVLQHLAKCNGEISWKSETESLKDFPKFPKRIEILRKRLKDIMGIDEDPFYPYKEIKSYKSKFKIEYFS